MILGYLFPNKDLYTIKGEYKGKFKFEKDEKIVQKADNIRINFVTYGWGRKFDLDEALDSGIGKLIKTNKRLIYKREIDPQSKNRFWSFPPIAVIEMMKAKKLKKAGIKEYFECNFDEIRGYGESRFLWMYGLGIFVTSIENLNGKDIENYYHIAFSERYKIIDDPLILNKEITDEYFKEMKKEYKEYKKRKMNEL